jgi:transposase-like protein
VVSNRIHCKQDWLRATDLARLGWQHERDAGLRGGPTTAEQQRLKELERENKELRRANEILKLASLPICRSTAPT